MCKDEPKINNQESIHKVNNTVKIYKQQHISLYMLTSKQVIGGTCSYLLSVPQELPIHELN